MAKDHTCQGTIDMHDIDDREKELEKAWGDLLKEKREVEARAHSLEQQEMQFKLKWDLLIQETQKLSEDKKKFELKKKFFDQVQADNQIDVYHDDDKVVNGEMFFSGVSNKKALKKRYKDLIKIYHPDGESGDNATVAEINREYDNLKESMEQ